MGDRTNKSPIWVYFDILESDEKFVVCKLCCRRFSRGGVGKAASTTPLLNHIRKMHFHEYCLLDMNKPAKPGSITTGIGPPIINLPHNHVPDMHAVALARCRGIFMKKECPVDLIPLSSEPEIILCDNTDGPVDASQGKSRVMFNLMTHGHPPQMKRVIKTDNDMEAEDPIKTAPPVKSILKPRKVLANKTATPVTSRESCTSAPEVCLRWNSFQTNIQGLFPNLIANESFVDVTLWVEGQSIKCHKVILSSCSAYFENLLKNSSIHHETVMLLHGFKFWQIRALLDFMYRGEVNIEQDKLDELLYAGGELQVKGLLREDKNLGDEQYTDNVNIFKESELQVKQEPRTPSNEDDDDEDYYPSPEYKKKQPGPKQKRKRRQPMSPPDPSLLKQVKINLKGTKSRPHIKQPKYYSPDYPEYDPDRCVSPPKLDTDPVFHIDNVKLEPIDMEVAKSPDYFEMDSLMNDSVAESQGQISQQKPDEPVKQKVVINKCDSVRRSVYGNDTTDDHFINDSYISESSKVIETHTSKKSCDSHPAVASTSKGFTTGKKIVVEGPNKRTIIVQRSARNPDSQYIKELDQALKTIHAERQTQSPMIRVRNLPTETTLKKFSTSHLTSILKRGELGATPVILKKLSGNVNTLLKQQKPVIPAPPDPDTTSDIVIKEEPKFDVAQDEEMGEIETLDDDGYVDAMGNSLLATGDDALKLLDNIILPD